MITNTEPRGLFIGAATLDLQYLVDGLPAQNIKKPSRDLAISTGGPAANAAALFARMGGRAQVVAAVGTHALGRLIAEDLASDHVDLVDIMAEEIPGERLPRVSSIFVTSDDGDRTAVTAPRQTPPLTLAPMERVHPEEADVVLVDGMIQEVARPAIEAARQAEKPVVLDSGSWKEGLETLLVHTTHAIVGETFRMPGADTPEEILDRLEAFGVPYVAMTRGGDPIMIRTPAGAGEVPVQKVDTVADTLGAGDFFHGAFAHGVARGLDFELALSEASRIVADRVQVFGSRRWLRAFSPEEVTGTVPPRKQAIL